MPARLIRCIAGGAKPLSGGRGRADGGNFRMAVRRGSMGAGHVPLITMTTTTPSYQPTARRPIAERFRRTARGTVELCVRAGVHPDVVSYCSILSAGFAAACFLFSARHPWLLLLAPVGMYLRLWLNMLDGMVALASGKASRRGEILNELPDRASDVLIFAGVAHSGLCHAALGYWAAIFAVFTAYVGIFGQAVGARREFGGVMSKPWRMVTLHLGAWVTLGLIWSGRGNPAAGGLTVLDWTCLIVIAGCVQTIAVRLSSTMRMLEAKGDARTQTTTLPETPLLVPQSGEPREGEGLPGNPTEHTFKSHDGAELYYRAWIPEAPTTRALIVLHRGHEHSARMAETIHRLGLSDVAIFAWDQRGHGRSPGPRGGAESLSAVVKDLDVFAKHLCRVHGVRLTDTVLMAHSVGAVIATAWVHDYAPPLRGLVLGTPAFRVKLYFPFAVPALRLRQKLLGPGEVKSYVKSRVLTHDPLQQAAYSADGRIFRQIAVNILLDLFDTSTRLIDDAGAITTPTLVLSAGSDWVVKRSAQWKFFERLSSPVKQFELLPGMYHAIFHEKDRHLVVERVRKFIDDCLARDPQPIEPLLDADKGGFTRTEYDRLRLPDGGLKWAVVRTTMKTLGRMSAGIRLGWERGFDSGVMLDYVYANRAQGFPLIGTMIDRGYLDSPGWRGIRQRRVNLEAVLRRAILDTHAEGRRVHVLDIAAGAGRYVLETLKSMQDTVPEATALLRDYQQPNIDAANALASQLGLSERVEVVQGDAFDRDSLASISPKPTIGIVSGLYELFPENEPLRRSLAGLADAIEPGGYLIYTCQPWHPQMEFIARALTNREGRPWVMRRRTQAEMDGLVSAAGFAKVDQLIDRWGIFTVGLARRA